MRTSIAVSILVVTLLPLVGLAQLNNGGLYANFGVDADTRSNYMKYGLVTGAVPSDDWFSPNSSVIDTSNAAYYLSQLQSGVNFQFSKRMSVPLYTKLNGKLWLDAAYGRDFMAASSLKDSTTFTSACKNGDDPSTWSGGVSSFPNKNDLVDVYAHMRRDGPTVFDSLWLFAAATTYGTTGSSYFDIELYKNLFTYSQATGTFTTAGPDAGHTQWIFDAAGNITQTGDMILAVNFTPGAPPVVDVRIWVSKTTWTTITPARFSFNASFNGSTTTFGYASIVSKTGTTAFGAGISNFTIAGTTDTTLAAPWGSNSTTLGWSANYQTQQMVEMGLNLSRIGLDPALYTALGNSACASLFSNIFFKSRASNSFTANLKDFVIPLVFLRPPVMDYSLQPDTLRCNRTTATIQITNNTTAGYYTWQTLSGSIAGANTDSTQLSINKPGTYIVSASPAEGCPATRTDTVVIPIDTFPPVASVNITMPVPWTYLQLWGGDVAASNYSTPFGGSQGLLWNWSGPQSFTSTIQNPQTPDTAWGTYQLIVTEKRNGCTDTAYKTINITSFLVLLQNDLKLTAKDNRSAIALGWTAASNNPVQYYIVEKVSGDNKFIPIATVTDRSFVDTHPLPGTNTYRVKAVAPDGQSWYSDVAAVNTGLTPAIYLASGPSGATMTIVSASDCQAGIVLYDLLGQALQKRTVRLSKGSNRFDLSKGQQRSMQVLSLYIDGQPVYSQKVIL